MMDWLSGFIRHRAREPNFSGDEMRMRGTDADRRKRCSHSQTLEADVSLYVQVAQERNVDQYDKLAEFMTLVREMDYRLNYKQRTQLILGLKARLILDLLKRMNQADCKAIQDHLNSFQQWITNCMQTEDQDGEVESSKSAFVELVQTLLRDQSQKETFFKEVFPLEYGVRFDTALQVLAWEFFHRLEEFLPVPSFSQIFSMFDIASSDNHLEQSISDHEDLKKILPHQQERKKLTKSEFTFTSDTILSTLRSKQTSVAPEDHIDQETNPNSQPHEFGLSPLSSSPCSEGADAADDRETAGEAAFQSPRCSENSVEEVKEHLDLSWNEEPSEESTSQSLTGSRGNGSCPFSKNSITGNKNTCLECGKTFSSSSALKNHRFVHTLAIQVHSVPQHI